MREIERRIQRAEKSQGDEDLLLPARPAGVPFDYEEHVKLMYDLMALAYQANITRVVTFMVSREVSNRTYPQVGVHRRPPRDLAPPEPRREDGEERPHPDVQRRRCSAHFLDEAAEHAGRRRHRCSTTRVLLYGSNMSNSNAHDHFPLPNLVVGGATGRLKGGRHLRYPDHTPMTNLLLTMLDKAGVRQRAARRQHGAAGEPVVTGLRRSRTQASAERSRHLREPDVACVGASLCVA